MSSPTLKKIKLVTSDMHLSAGRYLDGTKNPHEDFFFDREFCEFIRYFSTGDYGDDTEVELILNGDIFDFLNVPIQGDFPEVITKDVALEKLVFILEAHIDVIDELKAFVNRPGKRLTYNIGNHDMDMFFPEVRDLFCKAVGGENWSEDRVRVNVEKEYLEYPEGIQIHHGNQFEAVHRANYEAPFITENVPEKILYLPWGSVYVLKIINRLKWERDYIDKVKPAKIFILFGFIFDPFFTFKFFILSTFYFLHTRFIYSPKRRANLKNTLAIMRQEITPFHGLEDDAREILDREEKVNTVIFGHTHGAMQRHYRDGKTYINTGTWTRMINLDVRNIGQSTKLTFALVEYDQHGKPRASLQEWSGVQVPYKLFNF